MQNILKQLGLVKNDLIDKLYKLPKDDEGINAPKFQPIAPDNTIQADLLFMPTDRGFRYALVVADNGSKLLDAEPIKNKESTTVVKAFERIFHRGIISTPKFSVEVDDGSEFKGSTLKYFKKLNVKVRVAKTGRHRQQALVERANQILGTLLFKRMSAQEVLTGDVSREWVADLKKIIPLLNEYRAKVLSKQKIKSPADTIDSVPLCSGDACNLLSVGDKVRVQLDNPINIVDDKRLHGRFRSTDVRWSPNIRTIKRVILTPNKPTLYLLDGPDTKYKIEKVGYTKNQLQLVEANERLPAKETVRQTKSTKYTVEKLVDRIKIKNKIYFVVKWANYDSSENTQEPRSELIKFIPDMIMEYEQRH